MVEVSTSILSVKKEEDLKTFYNLEAAHTDYFHIDVMDGKFVKKDTRDLMFGYANSIKSISNTPLDIHLMVKDVREYILDYLPLEPNMITFHIEAIEEKDKLVELINLIKENNTKVGIAISPKTDIESVLEYLPYIHTVLVMTVEPGEGGQDLIKSTISKISYLRKHIDDNGLEVDIEADGGINLDNVESLKKVGLNIIVCGSAIINSKDYKETIKRLKE